MPVCALRAGGYNVSNSVPSYREKVELSMERVCSLWLGQSPLILSDAEE